MKKTMALFLALVMALSLCACGSSKSASAPYSDSQYSSSYNNKLYVADAEAFAYESPMEESSAGLSAQGASSASKASEKEVEDPDEQYDKIIYSANVQVETTDFEGSLQKLEELVQEYKGWIESSSVNGSNYSDRSRGNVSRRSASYTLRIPSERFNELMNKLPALGNIPYTHTYTENVTAQYYDVQARLTAYTAQETRLLEMMELAETVEDIIILEDRLTEVRYEIESLQSALNNWDRQVGYSTVYLSLDEVLEYTPEPQVQPTFGQRLASALKDGLESVGYFFEGLLFFLAEALPTLLVFAAFVALIVWIVRKIVKKHRAKKLPAKPAQTPAEPKAE